MDDDGPLIDLIYEAALVPELWPRALEALSARLGSFGGLLFTGTGRRWTCSAPVRDTFGGLVEDGWLARNSRLPRAMAAGLTQRAITDLDLFTADEMAVDPLYQVLRPLDWGWFLGTAVVLPGGDPVALSFERAFSDGPHAAQAKATLDHLRPHLMRAALLTARLGLDRHVTAAETLAEVGLPAAVLGSSGRLRASNALFDAAMPGTILAGHERIRLVDPQADRALVDALAGRDGQVPRAPLSLALKASVGAPARLLHLLPVRRAAHDLFTDAAFLVVLSPAESRALPQPALLGSLFALSPREVDVALRLARGETLAEHAAAAGVSINTARSQLKQIFEKTGVRRQAELVALLARLSGP